MAAGQRAVRGENLLRDAILHFVHLKYSDMHVLRIKLSWHIQVGSTYTIMVNSLLTVNGGLVVPPSTSTCVNEGCP